MHIDINCDLGEGSDISSCGRDASIMPFISRCNIACGGHAGSPEIMRLSIANALQHQLQIGAHPGYPDRVNFGRKSIKLSRNELLDSLQDQIGLLRTFIAEAGAELDHIKLHGALYNDAESNEELAEQILIFFAQEYPNMKIVGLANGAMEAVGKKFNTAFIREGFMDRRYLSKKKLAPRALPGSVITDPKSCLDQALALARGETFSGYRGAPIQLSVDTICLHGDTPTAPIIAKQLMRHLRKNGLTIHS
ncbi:5-oxoprolinase subunit PxpA [uncultured Microbulbifer sp.]|uniref:5-oxoprolinase subunit PxpA n=1 Tax=uncultured Microbulbifer sp. TaxID=348147 RepID=UPI002603708F|nr:5-oxoprolinase subunit PxpA [uncultured Microbulbifer sp.]